MPTFKTHLEYSLGIGGQKLAIMQVDHRERTFVQPFTLKTFPAHVAVPDNELFCLQDKPWGEETVKNFLQAMMDQAWEIGLRPKGLKDQTGELAAVRYHLEDMRRLALDVSPTIDAVQR